jgi:hypothetical protein
MYAQNLCMLYDSFDLKLYISFDLQNLSNYDLYLYFYWLIRQIRRLSIFG